MTKLKIDELNTLSKSKVIDYRKYFGEMGFPDKETKKRIKMAEELEEVFLYLFWFVEESLTQQEVINQQKLFADILKRVDEVFREMGVYDVVGEDNEYVQKHINQIVDSVVATTIERAALGGKDGTGNPFFTSKERAKINSVNEVNAICNYSEYFQKMEEGYVAKRWNTIMDGRERDDHHEVNGTITMIDEPFIVGDSYLMFPGDTSLGASLEQLINCRCKVEYLRTMT